MLPKEKLLTNLKELRTLRLEILARMSDLAIAGFGLVAALAWNDAIKALFDLIFPKAGGVIAQFIYAVIITVLVVLVTYKLGKIVNLAKKQLEES